MSEEKFDVAVIGSGPGGYVAAIRAAQLGLKTVCIDKWEEAGKVQLGGTCSNTGCIPSKALLDSSEHFVRIASGELAVHGISAGEVTLDINKMMARKNKIVRSNTLGIAALFKKNKVELMQGTVSFASANDLEITSADGKMSSCSADYIIIATGSVPVELPIASFDYPQVVENSGALSFDRVPTRLGVIGAGVIGLELGSVWRRLGSEVTLFEALPDFLPAADRHIAAAVEKSMRKQGLHIHLNTKVVATAIEGNQVKVSYENSEGTHEALFDKLIVAVGRRPLTEELNLGAAGVQTDERGFVLVDDQCHTNVPNIYAIGDVVRGPMLAHKASEEGVMAAECIAGQKGHVNYALIPNVIYTWPEVAWVGKSEAELNDEGRTIKTSQFPFMASGRAKAMEAAEGFVKLIADGQTDEILGAHIFGPNASELIAEMVLAMEYRATAEDIALTIHAHPTLAEAVHEAALGLNNRMIHL
jgi:dihydrolipoyl dehydrogenase